MNFLQRINCLRLATITPRQGNGAIRAYTGFCTDWPFVAPGLMYGDENS